MLLGRVVRRPFAKSPAALGFNPSSFLSDFLCDLGETVGLEYNLGAGAAEDIAWKFLAFDDQTCIAYAGRGVLICHIPRDERTAFGLCGQIFQLDPNEHPE